MVGRRLVVWKFLQLLTDTDRKSLLALRGVGPEAEAESGCFHGAG